MIENREDVFKTDLYNYLLSFDMVDKRLPESQDLEDIWPAIAEKYMPDAIREFNGTYPMVAFGWIMYVGMAIAKYWDAEWSLYSKVDNLYIYLRDRIDFDHLDDYICDKVLCLNTKERSETDNIVGECASRTYSKFCHLGLEPGSADAFHTFTAALHQMYLMGTAIELRRLGYHMTKVD